MSKITIAFSSFVLGVLTSFFLFSGSHASTLAQEPAQAPPPQGSPVIVGGGTAPTVPPITAHFKDFGLSVSGGAFGVDGSECVRCDFNGAILRYGGGNFQFTDFKFSGPVRIELTGAARNTLIFMDFVQKLAAGQAPPKPTVPNVPIIKTAMVKETVTGSFGTPK
jgi:hypothetical protein